SSPHRMPPVVLYPRSLHDALPICALMFAAVILPQWTRMPRRGKTPPSDAEEHPAYARTVKIASVSAIIWTFSALAQIVFTYSDVDRKSTRLNSSHVSISYAVFCLK